MPILETIAIKTVWGKAIDLLGKVPREVWYCLAALAAWWWFSSHYIEQGREEVLSELRAAQAETAEKALEAIAEADTAALERHEANAAVLEAQIERIEQAEAEESNPLDALF